MNAEIDAARKKIITKRYFGFFGHATDEDEIKRFNEEERLEYGKNIKANI